MLYISSFISGSTSSPLWFFLHPTFNLRHLVNPSWNRWGWKKCPHYSATCVSVDKHEEETAQNSKVCWWAGTLKKPSPFQHSMRSLGASVTLHAPVLGVARRLPQHFLWSWQAIREQSCWCCRSSCHSTSPPYNHKERKTQTKHHLCGTESVSQRCPWQLLPFEVASS